MYVQNTKIENVNFVIYIINIGTSIFIFYVLVLGITNYNDYVDSVRTAHHVRLLPSRTSGQNRCQDPDYR